MVASDRISTYDVVHPTPIPDKGKVLTGLIGLLVRPDAGDRAQPPRSPTPTCPRRCAAARMLVEKLEMVAGGVRRARLHHRVGLEGLPGHGRDLRDRAARRAAGVPAAARADLHARHQGRGGRPRRERRLRPRGRDPGRPPAAGGAAPALHRALLPGAAHARERGIILADTKFEFGRRRRRHDRAGRRGAHARLLALLAGRRLRARARPALLRQAVRARLGVRLGLGQDARPRRRAARRRGRRAPARCTWTPTSASRASPSRPGCERRSA